MGTIIIPKEERIVRDGLILQLDAANYLSYPLTGLTVNDLSRNDSNGVLTNGVSFSNDGGGNFVFDGVNQYIEITNNSLYQFSNIQPFTINIWVKITQTSGVGNFISYSQHDRLGYYFSFDASLLRTNGYIFDYFWGYSDVFYPIYRGIIPRYHNSIITNQWVMLTATSDNTNNALGMNVYQNGVLILSQIRGNDAPPTIDYTGLVLRVGARGDGAYFKGKVSQVSVYNKVLTPEEIQQNFNAIKYRYNL